VKTDLSYLPEKKRKELSQIVSMIRETHLAEMIILFGSYARNDWVEDSYDDKHYRYQSDIDLLIIVETKSEFTQTKLERDIEYQIDQAQEINTPVSILVHDIDFVNRRLSKAQYFFTDIKKEGIVLFDSKKYQLQAAKELLPKERRKLAEEDFKYYFNEAEGFKKGVNFYLQEVELNKAAFLLHQTAERLYTAILLVFTRYKPNTHNLLVLRKLSNALSNELISAFPLDQSEDRRVFKLLCKAYVDARYKPSYKITKDELLKLINEVEKLKNVGHKICLQKINSFTNQ